MIALIDDHRAAYGVEPIFCGVLPIAPSTYYGHVARRADPSKLPARAERDAELCGGIRRVWDASFQLHGVRKVRRQLRQLRREGIEVARCTVARLTRAQVGPARHRSRRDGAYRRQRQRAAPRPLDRVNRDFEASRPSVPRVADFTRVAARQGFVYAAFVIDAFARRIVGWRVAGRAETGLVPDAPEQALHARRPVEGGLVHRSDRGVRRVPITSTERLAGAGSAPPVGGVGGSHDHAPAETVIGLLKTAVVVRRQGPWRSPEAVEFATLDWVDRFNHRRLLEPIGLVPPAEAEAAFYAELEDLAVAA